MKSLPKMFLPLAMMLTGSIHAQDVSLGETVFNSDSAVADATWYEPMAFDHETVLEGFGSNAGRTRTITYSSGGLVAGVQTIKRQLVETSGAPTLSGSGNVTTTVSIWIAFDAADDTRVMKVERAGAVVFEAKAADTPPLYLPSLPTEGQTWDMAGTAITIEQVMPSNSGCRLKVKMVAPDGTSEANFLHAGEGLLLTETGEKSGWTVKR